MAEIAPGMDLGPYHVLEQVGRGGMATVFKAYHVGLDRYVAIKVLPAFLARDPGFAGRFRQEARTIARLRHPHIVTVYDFGEYAGNPYLVMAFEEGGTLAARAGEFSRTRVIRCLLQVADALAYAHGQGVIHRDLKPANVLLTRDGDAVLTDFGIARLLQREAQLTQTGLTLGTPEYMAPEQAMGDRADHRADLYALGCMAFELLAGRLPYAGETPMAILLAHLNQPVPDPRQANPALSPELAAVLVRALAKDPEQRWPSATAFARALAAAAGLPAPAPVQTLPAARRAEVPPRARGARRRLWLALLLALAAAGGTGWYLLPGRWPAAPTGGGGIAAAPTTGAGAAAGAGGSGAAGGGTAASAPPVATAPATAAGPAGGAAPAGGGAPAAAETGGAATGAGEGTAATAPDPAPAPVPLGTPRLAVAPASGGLGARFQLSVSGLNPGARAQVVVNGPGVPAQTREVVADPRGSAEAWFVPWPQQVEPRLPLGGTYAATVRDPASGKAVGNEATFQVDPGRSVTPPGSSARISGFYLTLTNAALTRVTTLRAGQPFYLFADIANPSPYDQVAVARQDPGQDGWQVRWVTVPPAAGQWALNDTFIRPGVYVLRLVLNGGQDSRDLRVEVTE